MPCFARRAAAALWGGETRREDLCATDGSRSLFFGGRVGKPINHKQNDQHLPSVLCEEISSRHRMWNSQYIDTSTPGDGTGTTYSPGSFPRYSPVSGVNGATPQQLGCCEQLDQDSFAIILAWMTGLTDPTTYGKIKTTANHIEGSGPNTTERWEEQHGRSPSSIAAEIAGLVTAADIARRNGDPASASNWESTADGWRNDLVGWTFTTDGYWGGHQYYERIDSGINPNGTDQIKFQEGWFYQHDIVDFGFLDLVRLGVRPSGDSTIATSLSPTASASDGNSTGCDQRRILRAGADLGPYRRILLRTRQDDRQRRAADVGRGTIRPARPVHRRRTQRRDTVGGTSPLRRVRRRSWALTARFGVIPIGAALTLMRALSGQARVLGPG